MCSMPANGSHRRRQRHPPSAIADHGVLGNHDAACVAQPSAVRIGHDARSHVLHCTSTRTTQQHSRRLRPTAGPVSPQVQTGGHGGEGGAYAYQSGLFLGSDNGVAAAGGFGWEGRGGREGRGGKRLYVRNGP